VGTCGGRLPAMLAKIRVGIGLGVVFAIRKQQSGPKQGIHRFTTEPDVEVPTFDPVHRSQRSKDGRMPRIDLDR